MNNKVYKQTFCIWRTKISHCKIKPRHPFKRMC